MGDATTIDAFKDDTSEDEAKEYETNESIEDATNHGAYDDFKCGPCR